MPVRAEVTKVAAIDCSAGGAGVFRLPPTLYQKTPSSSDGVFLP